MNMVPDWLRQRAQSTPSRLALAFERQSWSFLELDERVDGAVQALADLGIARGDRIGVLGPNSAGFVLAVHALTRIGAVLVPINARLTSAEVDWQVKDAELKLV